MATTISTNGNGNGNGHKEHAEQVVRQIVDGDMTSKRPELRPRYDVLPPGTEVQSGEKMGMVIQMDRPSDEDLAGFTILNEDWHKQRVPVRWYDTRQVSWARVDDKILHVVEPVRAVG